MMRSIKAKKRLSPVEYYNGIKAADINLLSQAITLIESNKSEDQALSQEIISLCLPDSGNSIRIGITGVPGVGKSTFIEALGKHITSGLNKSLAVLAIDPSSEISRGSILGDKTRMEELASDPRAYIRPSPSAGSLGGVARATREAIILCEAAGYEVIFVETVGVGQSETAVHAMVDFFLLLMLAGAGDELQGIKRGIMEMADLIVINKADGQNEKPAQLAKAQLKSALHLFPPSSNEWVTKALTCSALEKSGIKEVWQETESFINAMKENGFWQSNRNEQAVYWMKETIFQQLKSNFLSNKEVIKRLAELEHEVTEGRVSPFIAAEELMKLSGIKKTS